jgi:hypothetical protein
MRGVVFGVLAVVGLSGAAWAHGDAAWIMNSPVTGHCCGPNDCRMEMSGDVVAVGSGWQIVSTGQRFRATDEGVFPSIDGHYWTCRKARNAREDMNGAPHVHCLFVPAQS